METIFTDPTTSAAYLIASFLMPVIVMLIKQSGWPNSVNSIIALVVYVVTGVVAVLLSDVPITVENVAPLAAIAMVVGTAAYNLFWNAIGTGEGAGSLDARVTSATSVVR